MEKQDVGRIEQAGQRHWEKMGRASTEDYHRLELRGQALCVVRLQL